MTDTNPTPASIIIGIDEVGRGSLAGPLVVGAVALDGQIPGLTDSKLLSLKKREMLDLLIREQAQAIGLGWVSNDEIDSIGLSAALHLAAERALGEITIVYDSIIIDGTIRLVDDPRVVTLIKADLTVPQVSAASIVAKVARDRYMKQIASDFPGYGFEGNVGYGSKVHMEAIRSLGPSSLHRKSFEPVRSMLRK